MHISTFVYLQVNNTGVTLVGIANNPSGETFGYFGYAIDSTNGTRLVVGAYGNDVGASTRGGFAYLFAVDAGGGTVVQTCALTRAIPANEDYFGISAGIARRWLVVGPSGFDAEFANQGAVDLYQVISACSGGGFPFQSHQAVDASQPILRCSLSLSGIALIFPIADK